MVDHQGREVNADLCVGCKIPTARPITRPQSARANRQVDAVQYNRALRHILADQTSSIQDARFSKHLGHLETQACLQEQHQSKALQMEAFKQRQRQSMAERFERYYSAELRRSNEWESQRKAKWCSVRSSENARCSEMRAQSSEINKRRIRQHERFDAIMDHQITQQAQLDAAQHRAALLENKREEQHRVNQKKIERMEAFRDAQEQRIERQRTCELMKEMRRKEGRVLQLTRDKLAWQAASCFREVSPQEVIISERLHEEQLQLGDVYNQVQKRQRPKSANATVGRGVCPRIGGISVFSEVSRSAEIEALRSQAVKHGPPVSVIDPRIGCV